MLHMRDVQRMTGLSQSTIKRRVQDGTFSPIHTSVRHIGWRAVMVKDWIAEQEAAKRDAFLGCQGPHHPTSRSDLHSAKASQPIFDPPGGLK
jgi:predicted DNA-binding transcriptional regulator AlpA